MASNKYIVLVFIFLILPVYSVVFPPSGKVLLIIGTRPDTIKMAPVYHALVQQNIATYVCSTDQHLDLTSQMLNIFNIVPDSNLRIMQQRQDLFYITTSVIDQLKDLYKQVQPSLVLVQGDTTTAMCAALAAFYLKIPIGHIEAGLRTYDMQAPFPEELNRRIITLIASYHFAPTQLAVDCLLKEHVDPAKIFNVGNTVVDALHYIQKKIGDGHIMPSQEILEFVASARKHQKKIFLFTAHRRESIPHGLTNIFKAIKKSLALYPDIFLIYPLHPNPIIKKLFDEVDFFHTQNILVTKPLSYIDMVYLLHHSCGVITDSGGLQEEAISLGKPTLVLRNVTERYEGVDAGIAKLVGDNEEKIIQEIGLLAQLHRSKNIENDMYGNGDSGNCIAHIIQTKLYI